VLVGAEREFVRSNIHLTAALRQKRPLLMVGS
jgi:hypothetical protein